MADQQELHYYASPIGDGEFSRNRFRPACDSNAEPVFIPPSEQTMTEPPHDARICKVCEEVRGILGMRVQP